MLVAFSLFALLLSAFGQQSCSKLLKKKSKQKKTLQKIFFNFIVGTGVLDCPKIMQFETD